MILIEEVDRKAGDRREVLRALLRIALRGIEARPDRGRTHVDLVEDALDALECLELIAQRSCIRLELLA